MTNTLYNLSGKFDRHTVVFFEEITRITRSLGIPFFVVGAAARDILLAHVHGINPQRATADIDIGILVSDWEQFHGLKAALIKIAGFKPGRQEHRLVHPAGIPLDLVPFGKIAKETMSITWPPDHEIAINIAGFLECYQHAVEVKISTDPEVVIKVASLAGLAILKIISWDESPERRGKDASDLLLILHKIADTGIEKQLMNNEIDILEDENYDFEMAAVRFLGREMSAMASAETKAILTAILYRESVSNEGHGICADALRGGMYSDDAFAKAVGLVNALYRGLAD